MFTVRHTLRPIAAASLAVMGILGVYGVAFAQAAADPTTIVESTRINAIGQASGIDASAATGSQTGANGSAGYGPFSLGGGYKSSTSAGLTRVRTGAAYIESATVRNSQIDATGTASNVRAQNATVDTGVVVIGKGAAS